MRRIFGLVIAGGFCLGLATEAVAQTAVSIGGPFGGGISINSSPYGYGYNPLYGGMGYNPTGYGLGVSNPLVTSYSSGYLGYTPGVTSIYSSSYSGYTPGVTSIYSSAYSGLTPGLGYNPYLPYPTTVAYPAYGTSYINYAPIGVYGYRRGFVGGLGRRAFFR